MAKYIRYALAAVCFACCVGCLALWWRTHAIQVNYLAIGWAAEVDLECGMVAIAVYDTPIRRSPKWRIDASKEPLEPWFQPELEKQGRFGSLLNTIYFPLWYPALISALAGVGVLRFRRHFSIRSALVGLTVVAALLGMAVVL